jgi:alkylation response protein AidB-like acyl-CoA dehydrogenase
VSFVPDSFDQVMIPSAEELEYLQYVRQAAVEKIAPRAEEFDRTGEFPWANFDVLNSLGLNAAFIPKEYGGTQLSFSCVLLIVEALSRACPSTAISWATTLHAIGPLCEYGTEEQKSRFLPRIAAGKLAAVAITESTGGSDVLAMRSTLVPDGDDLVLSGSKVFITNGDVADLLVVFARWPGAERPRDQLSAVLVDPAVSSVEVVRRESKLGHRASSTTELRFSDCRIRRADVLGELGAGFPVLLHMLNRSRPSIAAQAIGIAEAALDETRAYVNNREQFGQRLVDFPAVQFILADMASHVMAAKAMLSHVATLIDSGATDFDIEASVVKLLATDAAMNAATSAVQLQGGYGYMTGSTVERLFRDAKVTQIWEGANELHRARIGKSFRD